MRRPSSVARALAAISTVAGLCACYSLALGGRPCSDAGLCLTGYRCVDGVCVSSSGDGGGGAAGGSAGGGGATGGSGGGASGGGGGGSAGGVAGGCDGVFRQVDTPFSLPINDVVSLPGGRTWVVGEGAPRVASSDPAVDGGAFASVPGCAFDVFAAWAPPTGPVFVAGDSSTIERIDGAGASCTPGPQVGSGSVWGMIGFPYPGGYELIAVDEDGRIHHRGVQGATLDLTFTVTPSNGHLYDVDGLSANLVFAVGDNGTNDRGSIYQRVPDAGWVLSHEVGVDDTRFFAVSMVSANLAYAAGKDQSVWQWDGGSWAPAMAGPGFDVYGLKAFAADRIYAVGNGSTVRRWNGSTWSQVANVSRATSLNRIRGANECSLWVVGAVNIAATTTLPP